MKILLVHTPFNIKRPLTIIAWLIRKVTGSKWNHCAILVTINKFKDEIENSKICTGLELIIKAKEL